MNDSAVPDWIKRIKEQEDQEKAKDAAQTQQQTADAQTVRAKGPEFWKQLLEELKVTADSLQVIGLQGSVSDITTAGAGEEACQVSVAAASTRPRRTYTNLFYSPGQAFIRCHTAEEKAFRLVLRVVGGQVKAMNSSPMNPAEAAEAIVRPMVGMVRS